jgi:hypothetical protein
MFAVLEALPSRHRKSREFEERAYELAKRLGLNSEHFCSRCSVLDRERGPCWPPGYQARDDWFKVRAVRLRLLEMAGFKVAPRGNDEKGRFLS